jgi:hypothetical protein
MFWNRIFQGIFGLFLAFSAGEQLQLWIDEGTFGTGQKDASPGYCRMTKRHFLTSRRSAFTCGGRALAGLVGAWW